MGRTHKEKKRRSTYVSETDEREKIKESILKVFRAHLTSPNHGGALLVGPSKTEDQENDLTKNKDLHKGNSSSSQSSNVSSSVSMSGRGRRKGKSVVRRKRQSKKSTKSKELEKSSAVSKHMNVAHGIVYSSLSGKDDVTGKRVGLIAHPRLTQKVGIVSTGKKSAAVSRGLQVPEHISKQTDEAIKKIVTDAEADVPQPSADLDVVENLVLSRGSSINIGIKSRTPASLDMETFNTTIDSVRSVPGIKSPCDTDNFTENFDITETVGQLMSSLKSETLHRFPGRDCLTETKNRLLKLLKQNAPRSATPTPIPVLNKITHSGNIQRSLFDSFHPQSVQGNVQVKHADHRASPSESETRHSGGFQFDFGSSAEPKINFAYTNPFPASSGSTKSKNVCHDSRRHTSTLGELKKSKAERDVNDDLDNCTTIDSKTNMFMVKRPSGTMAVHEDIRLLYDNARLLEYNRSRENLCEEIRKSYNSGLILNHNTCPSSGRNLVSINEPDNCMYDSKGNEDFFVSMKKGRTLGSPVLESRTKLTEPIMPLLSSDARNLLQVNDDNNNVKAGKRLFEAMEVDDRGCYGAVNLLEKNDILMEIAEQNKQNTFVDSQSVFSERYNDRDVGSNSQCSHCSHCSQGSGQSTTDSTSQNKGQQPTDYMPSFHESYYRSDPRDLAWQHKDQQLKAESMDLLDYVDRDSHMDSRGDKKKLPSGTMQDGSPLWFAKNQLLIFQGLLPPQAGSPDAPKLYPRKMY